LRQRVSRLVREALSLDTFNIYYVA
jgi:hypothetical protein